MEMFQKTDVDLLIVEDDSSLSGQLAEHLARSGYRVHQTTTESGALELLEQQAPRLLIVDGVLEHGSGLDLIRRLRERPQRPPVVFISSFWRDLESLTMLLEQLEVDAVMHKPFNPLELVARVDSILGFETDPPASGDPAMQKLESMLQTMKEGVSRTLPGRIDALGELLAELPDQPQRLGEAIRLAHSIAGTAGTFEFLELSAVASQIEELLVDIQRRDGLPRETEKAVLSRHIERAREGSKKGR